jgi:alcohol dehydrogenase (NADP+)
MKTLPLHDGTPFPAFGLGTWKPQGDDVYNAVRIALEAGYRHIDCAAIYGNEDVIGRALADAFAAGDARREDVWVTSKLWNDRHAPDEVRPALEKTLADLGLEYLDLYLMHWPVALRPGTLRPESADAFVSPDELPIELTWEAMTALPGTGLTRQIGVSNFSTAKIRRVHEATNVLPAVNQVELHPYLAQNDLLAATREMGVVLTAYSPLGTPDSGEMFGRDDPFRLLDDPVVSGVAEKHTATPGQVLIAWAMERGTSVIPKSTNDGRIRENLAAAALRLTADDMADLAALDRHHRYIDGSFWCPDGSPWTVASLWDE